MKGKETLRGGTFHDDQGNAWKYCGGKCTLKKKTITDTDGRRVEVRCESVIGSPCTCSCVLFDMSGGGRPKLVEEDGNWVTNNPRADYSCRCVEKV